MIQYVGHSSQWISSSSGPWLCSLNRRWRASTNWANNVLCDVNCTENNEQKYNTFPLHRTQLSIIIKSNNKTSSWLCPITERKVISSGCVKYGENVHRTYRMRKQKGLTLTWGTHARCAAWLSFMCCVFKFPINIINYACMFVF